MVTGRTTKVTAKTTAKATSTLLLRIRLTVKKAKEIRLRLDVMVTLIMLTGRTTVAGSTKIGLRITLEI